MSWTTLQPNPIVGEKVDPQLLLSQASEFADHARPEGPWEVLLELDSFASFKETVKLFESDQYAKQGNRLSLSYGDAKVPFVSATVTELMLKELILAKWIKRIEWAEPLVPQRPMRRRKPLHRPTDCQEIPKSEGGSVLLGIIDHGCPFAHRAYRTEADRFKTRVLSIWDQDPYPDFPENLKSPKGFGYGRQATRSALNEFMTAATTSAGRIDEKECYRLAQYDAVDIGLTHGSHTLGRLAAGINPNGESVSDEQAKAPSNIADIVFVQFPRSVLLAPSHSGEQRCILDGIRYIMSCAKVDQRVVVVVDYGSYLGPHDGTSFFERALDALIESFGKVEKSKEFRLKVVFPTGNGYQDPIHGQVKPMKANDLATLDWWIPTHQEVPSYMEIWVPKNRSRFKIEISPPGVECWQTIAPTKSTFLWGNVNGKATAQVTSTDAYKSGQLISIRIGPTLLSAPGLDPAIAGRWKLRFTALKATKDVIDVYTCWGGHNIGFPARGIQPRLCNPTGSASIPSSGTIIGSACGEHVIVIGGLQYSRSEFLLGKATYSSVGPSRGKRIGPDALAVSDQNAALKGVAGFGTIGCSMFRIWGASVAAPLAARSIANHPTGALKTTKYPSPPQNSRRRSNLHLPEEDGSGYVV